MLTYLGIPNLLGAELGEQFDAGERHTGQTRRAEEPYQPRLVAGQGVARILIPATPSLKLEP